MEKSAFRPVGELTYNESVAELEKLLKTMQSDNCDIDLLSTYTRRAAELLASCRSRLTTTESELQAALADLEKK